MRSLELRTARLAITKDGDECVLLIEAAPNDATRILDELDSATNERFRVKWVSEVSSGIKRLRRGGVGPVALDLALPDSHSVETYEKPSEATPCMPILNLSVAGTEGMARRAMQREPQNYLVNHDAGGCR